MKPGDVVADFDLSDQDGTVVKLSELLGRGAVVLFFYPAAMTGGCTAESCHFRDLGDEFSQLGAQPVGISADPVPTQHEFARLNGFDYPLLSDVDGEVAARFGVRRRFGPLPVKRHTFVIGTDSRIIDVIRSEFRMRHHADQALATLRKATTH